MKIRSIKARTVARMILRNQLHLEELMDMDYETGDELEDFEPLTDEQLAEIRSRKPTHDYVFGESLDDLLEQKNAPESE